MTEVQNFMLVVSDGIQYLIKKRRAKKEQKKQNNE